MRILSRSPGRVRARLFRRGSGRQRAQALLGIVALLTATSLVPALANHYNPGPPSTTLNVQPAQIDGNPTCSSLLPSSDFLFEHKLEPVEDKTVNLSFNGQTGTLVVDQTNRRTFDFTFTGDFAVAAVFVKAGNGGNLFDYRSLGGAVADTDLHGAVNPKNNKFFGLSHISFCVSEAQAELDIQKTPDGGIVDVDDTAAFTLTVTNVGNVTAQDVVLDDTLPSGFAWSENSAACSISGGVLHCEVGDLAPGASFSVTVSAPTGRADCGQTVNNPDATADASNGRPDSDSGSLRIRCGAIAITKTAKHKDQATQPNLDAEFTINDAGALSPLVVRTGSDGVVCVDGLRVGSAVVTETGVPTGYAAPSPKTATVTEGNCAGTIGAAVSVSFSNDPLTDVTIAIDSQVPGGTQTIITCDGVVFTTPTDGTATSGDGSFSIQNQKPKTINCEIVIDP